MSEKIPKHESVKNLITNAICQQVLVEKLPGERTLAKQYGVSYMTMRKVIENLVDEGIVYKIPNLGVYVNTGEIDHRPLRRVATRNLMPSVKLISAIPKPSKKPLRHSVKENSTNQDCRKSAQLEKLKQENEELKRANELLKRVATYFARIHEERI
jgi:DNA-binding transcriptional regulator YhcF (GntR family)